MCKRPDLELRNEHPGFAKVLTSSDFCEFRSTINFDQMKFGNRVESIFCVYSSFEVTF